MHSNHILDHKVKNALQTGLLIIGMSLLLALISRLLFGPDIWLWMLFGLIVVLLSLPKLSPQWLIQLYQGRSIDPRHSPELFTLLERISDRAGLPQTPKLYWVPSNTLNAFAVGSKDNAAIAVTDGLFRRLNLRELAGVLAHEISHIRNNDLRLMMLADLFTRLTHVLSLVGLFLIFISLPLMFVGVVTISLWGLLLLLISPSISALLQLGLSRVREFDADLDAARLTGDPRGLASALANIDQQTVKLWQRIFLPSYHDQQPSVLRTHPDTATRIDRLMALQGPSERFGSVDFPVNFGSTHDVFHQPVHTRPRHRIFRGIWR